MKHYGIIVFKFDAVDNSNEVKATTDSLGHIVRRAVEVLEEDA